MPHVGLGQLLGRRPRALHRKFNLPSVTVQRISRHSPLAQTLSLCCVPAGLRYQSIHFVHGYGGSDEVTGYGEVLV